MLEFRSPKKFMTCAALIWFEIVAAQPIMIVEELIRLVADNNKTADKTAMLSGEEFEKSASKQCMRNLPDNFLA